MQTLNTKQAIEMLLSVADRIIRNEPYLTKVDSAIGDGDHGIGMRTGMKAAEQYLKTADAGQGVLDIFTGMAGEMQRTMGGASGMIFSGMFAGGGKPEESKAEITPAELAAHIKAGLDHIMEMGGAKPGDKTMVDALFPAVKAMQSETGSFEEMFTAGADAAKAGMEKTSEYVARFGRAKNLGERAIGHPDAGAVSTWLILLQMSDYAAGADTPDPVWEEETAESSPSDIKWKKKIINDPSDVVAEEGEGFLAAFGKDIMKVSGVNGFVKKLIPNKKTALLIGGGSGHEPMFGFFIGNGLADASANGNVFASPDPVTIVETAKAADRNGGVIFLYGNYAGDNLNFDKAAEELAKKGMEVRTVRIWDDIASAPADRITDRRGIGGDVLAVKIAGAACDVLPLEEAFRVASKARDNLYSIGVGLDGATIPGQKDPIFSLPPDEMEYGLGIHGEPGVQRIKVQTADQIAEKLTDAILKESGIQKGDTVVTYVNGLGSTTLMELMILNRKLAQILNEKGIVIHDMDVNSLVTTMEMAGASISIMKMDDELIRYYDMPCRSPYYNKF